MLKHKETKSHIKNDEHFATRGDLRDAEHRLDIAILAVKHEVKETVLQLRHEIKETELRLKGEIKAISNSKWFDRSLAITVFAIVATPYIKPASTIVAYLIQSFV